MSSPTTGDPVAEARSKEIDRALKEVSLGFHWLQSMIFERAYDVERIGLFEKKKAKGMDRQGLMADNIYFYRMRNVWRKKSSCYCWEQERVESRQCEC